MKAFFHRSFTQLTLTSLLVSLGFLTALPSHAEGSRDLTASGTPGFRPFLDDFNGAIGGITRRNQIKVFVNDGETLYLGSSAQGLSSTGVSLTDANRRIRYTSPSGTQALCPADQGRILNRTQELAGPNTGSNPNGYNPCQVNVTQTGIWTIEFLSPNLNGNDPAVGSSLNTQATADWAIGGPNDIQKATATATGYNNRGVAAWDVTVYAGTTEKKGRAFANYLPLNTGANARGVHSNIFVLTEDGYRYRVGLNGIDPFGFILFANNKGFRDSNNNLLYRSIDIAEGVNVHNPTQPDTSTETTHKIFFDSPDPAMPGIAAAVGGSTWLYSNPVAPAPVTNFEFRGVEANTLGQAGIFPLGGNFSFNSPQKGIYNIVLDLNQNGIFGDGNDRFLVGNAFVGSNQAFWDGKDGVGNTVNPSTIPYSAQITINLGEVHFPILDPENNINGIKITRLNGLGSEDTTVYYNDTKNGVPLTGNGPPSPANALIPTPANPLGGISSANGAHKFGITSGNLANGFGNNRGIDTWANLKSDPTTINNIKISAADLDIEKAAISAIVVPNGIVRYTIDVTNFNNPPISISNVQQITVTDTFPAQLTGVTIVSCAITTGTGACGTRSVTGNTFTAKLDLNSGAVARFVIDATVLGTTLPGTVITNTSKVERQPDITDPVNQDGEGGSTNLSESSSASVTVIGRPSLTKSVKAVTTPLEVGGTLEYTITVSNPNNANITDFVLRDVIPSQLQVVGGSVQVQNSVTGTTNFSPASAFSSNFDGNGTPVTFTNPGTLSANSSFRVIYRATIKAGATNPILNQAQGNFKGDGGTPIVSDASNTGTTTPGSGPNPGVPDGSGNVNQSNNGPNDLTEVIFQTPPNPLGSKSVRLANDADSSGSVTPNDELEYTITYINTSASDITNFVISDQINPTYLQFLNISGFTTSGTTTNLVQNNNFNGQSDQNLTDTGTLAANGGRVTIKFRVKVLPAAVGQTLQNQASATSANGTFNPSRTDATSGPGEIPQILDDGTNTGNDPNKTDDDEPTLLTVAPIPPKLNKSVEAIPPLPLTVGGRLRYSITITNPNSVPLEVTIADAIPAQLRVIRTTLNGGGFTLANSLPNIDFDGTGTPIELTEPSSLAANSSVTMTYEAEIKSGASSPILNQALATYKGGGEKPILSDASNTGSTQPGSGPNPGVPDETGKINQPNDGSSDKTSVIFSPPATPVGTKSVALVSDVDGSGTNTPNDVVEYTITYNNPSTTTDIKDFTATDTLDPKLEFIAGSYSFTATPGTTVQGNSGFNGTSDTNLTKNPNVLPDEGTLARNNGRVTIKFRARILNSAASSTVPNTARATSQGQTNPIEVTANLPVAALPPRLSKSSRAITSPLTVGGTLEYTITVTNPNSNDITNLVVSDAIPAQLQVVGGTVQIVNSVTGTTNFTLASAFSSNFDGNGNPVTLTTPGTLPANSSFRIIYRTTVKPGSTNPILNQAQGRYNGDGGKPLLSDASNTGSTEPGSGPNPGIPGEDGKINQPNSGLNDQTQVVFTEPPKPVGRKSVKLAVDADNSGSVTTNDEVEYTIVFTNPADTPMTNVVVTDQLNAGLEFVSHTVTVDAGTTLAKNNSFNGTSNQNLTTIGTLGPKGEVRITIRAKIKAAAGTTIQNQAIATGNGFNPVVTDASSKPGDISQTLDDQADTNSSGKTDDDDPTTLEVGTPRLRLVKRITNVFRDGAPLGGLTVNTVVDDPNDNNDTVAGWPTNFLLGIPQINPQTTLSSGDEVEYTIYFLVDGDVAVKNVRICDPISELTSYLPDTFGAGRGISLNRAGQITSLTNTANDDAGAFFGKLAPLPDGNSCPNPSNPDGSMLVNLGDLPNTSGQNYGFVRFRVRVD